MKTLDITSTQTIFESIGKGDVYFETWQRDIHPVLCEVAVSPEQIKQLFQNIEAGSRTTLGKGIDAVKSGVGKISDAWFNKFGGMLQQSAPVQAFDQKWEKIKSDIAAKHPDLANKLAKYGEFAKNNPNLHKFLLAIAASIASSLGVALAGGVGAGALAVGSGVGVATGIINIADRLLQGQAASTAIGRGATAGLVAGLTAAGIKAATDLLKGIDAVTTIRGSYKITYDAVPGGHYQFFLKKEDYEKFLAAQDAIKSTVGKVDFMSNPSAYMAASDKASGENLKLVQKFFAMASTPEYQEAAAKAAKITIEPNAIQKAVGAVAKMAKAWNPVISAIVGTAASGAGQKPATETPPASSEPAPVPPARESVEYKKVRKIFESIESQLHDIYLKKQFTMMMEAGEDKKPGFFSRMAKKFTTKVTADQLEKSWIDAGSPVDSEAIAKVLHDAGINKELIDKTYTDFNLPAPTTVLPTDNKAEPTISTNTPVPTGTEPSMDAGAPAPTGPTGAPAPTGPTGATGVSAPDVGDIFKDPDALVKSFDDWLNAGNNVTPGLRAALRQALLDVGFVKVESRRQKLERIINESNKLKKQINLIKRQTNETIRNKK